jgi:(p)ppGpp synthase/HD superfamily hydrolase
MNITPRLHHAIQFATRAHDGHYRKDGDIPYISHPFAVASIVSEYTDDEDIIIGALFHDILEDIDKEGFSSRVIMNEFGTHVLDIIDGCTEKVAKSESWKKRKDSYIAHIAHAPTESLYIIAADKMHNALSTVEDHKKIGEAIWNRFGGTKEQTQWFYRAVYESLRENRCNEAILSKLDQVIIKLEEL